MNENLKTSKVELKMIPSDDCYFLLYFIMGTYFGPAIKGERIKKSSLQRKAEGRPPYTVEQLTGSCIKVSEIEQIYYYLLRKAEKSHVVKVPILHQYIKGGLPSQAQDGSHKYPQFPELFPPHLHPQMEFLNQSIANVVYIRNPAIFYIKGEDVEKFKRLTRLEDLFIENNVEANAASPRRLPEDKNIVSPRKFPGDKNAEDVPIVKYYRGSQKKRRLNEILLSDKPLCSNGAPKSNEDALLGVGEQLKIAAGNGCESNDMVSCQSEQKTKPALQDGPKSSKLASQPRRPLESEVIEGPGIVILASPPSREELDKIVDIAKDAYAVTGSAARGHVGSAIGLMDIGEAEDSYMFRVALPGVKRENRAFQCVVESDGRVLIKGETVTGEKKVERYSQTFVMHSQNLCPPGPFSISFQLPGPVDTQQFSGNFGTNAILEGIVMKRKPSRPKKPNTPLLMPSSTLLPESSK